MKSKKTEKLLTFENEKDVFNGFATDKERIRYNSNNYKNMGIAKAFALYYGVNVSNETKMDNSGITTVLLNDKNEPYAYHTWFARYYKPFLNDLIIKKHTERINSIIENI